MKYYLLIIVGQAFVILLFIANLGLGREASEFFRTGEGGTIVRAEESTSSSSLTCSGGLMGLWGVCEAVSAGSVETIAVITDVWLVAKLINSPSHGFTSRCMAIIGGTDTCLALVKGFSVAVYIRMYVVHILVYWL